MDEGFSGVVRISNISDFIEPNLNCIIPLEQQTQSVRAEEPLVNIRKKEEKEDEVKTKKKVIKVSLNDCLACNGCITSAETVLVEEQSIHRFLEGVGSHEVSVVTISPQSVCSIAARRKISTAEAARLISSYLRKQGVTYVVDSSFGRLFALEECYNEFNSRSGRPVIASACPGFVCYAEKTHGNLLVPLLSKVRSPQSILGSLIKDYLSKKEGISSCSIYHATVMPCFDKKLEASRPDFVVSGTQTRETDCVISTAELDGVLQEIDIRDVQSSSDNWLLRFSTGDLIGEGFGSSGGYADYIASRYLSTHQGAVAKSSKMAKYLNVTEITLDGAVVLRLAKVYGFKNLQNLVRKLKTGKCNYDYVEAMACPGGCSNGGGQIRGETSEEREQLLTDVERLYAEIRGNAEEQFSKVKVEWSTFNHSFKSLLFTDFRPVETSIAQTIQW